MKMKTREIEDRVRRRRNRRSGRRGVVYGFLTDSSGGWMREVDGRGIEEVDENHRVKEGRGRGNGTKTITYSLGRRNRRRYGNRRGGRKREGRRRNRRLAITYSMPERMGGRGRIFIPWGLLLLCVLLEVFISGLLPQLLRRYEIFVPNYLPLPVLL